MDMERNINQAKPMEPDTVELRRLDAIDDQIMPLMVEAERDGHRFVRRLNDNWLSGRNRFDKPGEFLLGAYANNRLVAIGGLNRDPYAQSDDVGRLRHLYVRADSRRLGVGRLLVRQIVIEAAKTFSVLRLRTATADAAAFYERLGFATTGDDTATHIVRLPTILS